MTKEPPLFNWQNVEPFAPLLLGEGSVQTWEIDTPFGRSLQFQVDNESGDGKIEFLDLARGLKAVIFDCNWRQSKAYRVRDGEWIRFNFSLSANVAMQLAGLKSVIVDTPSWRIINNPPGREMLEELPAGAHHAWVTVCCKPEFVEAVAGKSLDDMPELLQDALEPRDRDSYYEYYEFTSRLNSITADIMQTTLKDSLRVAFIEARCVELLCCAIDFLMHSRAGVPDARLSSADKVAIESARSILIQQHAHPPTVAALSSMLGINRNKLFYGFRSMFGQTVSEFIQEQRLHEGKRLLRQTELSVLEIAQRVGFNHQSNFATAMKRYFGMTPRQFRD
ncbi:MAG: AraC family transcriptional regulator [Pseudomonadota bacterium]